MSSTLLFSCSVLVVVLALVATTTVSASAALHDDIISAFRHHPDGHQKGKQLLDANGNLTFRVCGYYCGPNWCSDRVIPESKCVSEGYWGIPPEAAEECVDDCCKIHDRCCGLGLDRPACNDAIVSCVRNKCLDAPASSKHRATSGFFCAAAVWAAMKTVSGWCCGSRCPTYFAGKHMTLNHSTSFCNKQSGLKLSFDTTTHSVHATLASAATSAPTFKLDQYSNSVYISGLPSEFSFSSSTSQELIYLPHAQQMISPGGGKNRLVFEQC